MLSRSRSVFAMSGIWSKRRCSSFPASTPDSARWFGCWGGLRAGCGAGCWRGGRCSRSDATPVRCRRCCGEGSSSLGFSLWCTRFCRWPGSQTSTADKRQARSKVQDAKLRSGCKRAAPSLRPLRNLASCTALLGALAACEHTSPFRPDEGGADGPLIPAQPAQVTFSPGQDLIPAWLPDGSAFVYTAERRDRADHDRCLAFMPGAAGTISTYACSTVAADDSINVYDEAAIRGDSIAYVRASTERFLPGLGPDRQELVIAPLEHPTAVRVVQRIPFTTTWGATYDAISHLAWLGAGRLAFIGEHVTYPRACSSCAPDTVRIGVEIAITDVSAAVTYSRMTDGDSASSLAPAANGDTVYFTKNGDSHVFRRTLSTATTDTLLDFTAGVARDLSASGGVIAAIVGGLPGGPAQPDRGGRLFIVEGQLIAQFPDSTWLFRRPALSPDGVDLVVSAWRGGPNEIG